MPPRLAPAVRGLGRPLSRLCLPVNIREIDFRLWLQRLDVDPGLDENESPVVSFLLLQAKKLLTTRFQFFGTRFEQVEIGTELKPQDDQDVHDHRQQHTIPPGEGAADDEFILVPIVEVEMYQ